MTTHTGISSDNCKINARTKSLTEKGVVSPNSPARLRTLTGNEIPLSIKILFRDSDLCHSEAVLSERAVYRYEAHLRSQERTTAL